jgi:glyoxylate utilization-related uncharacterized protein
VVERVHIVEGIVVNVTRIGDAASYEAPGHYGMAALRLQGREHSSESEFWTGLSYFLPAGGAQRSASPLQRTYFVVAGEMTLIVGDERTVLRPFDSVHIAAGDERELVNQTNLPATVLVTMAYPKA